MLFWALIASGEISMRKIDGWHTLPAKPLDQQIDLADNLNLPEAAPPNSNTIRYGTDSRAFYDKYYTPSNAVLVVAGDVEPETVKALADKT